MYNKSDIGCLVRIEEDSLDTITIYYGVIVSCDNKEVRVKRVVDSGVMTSVYNNPPAMIFKKISKEEEKRYLHRLNLRLKKEYLELIKVIRGNLYLKKDVINIIRERYSELLEFKKYIEDKTND